MTPSQHEKPNGNWITDSLLADTQRVWGRVYGRDVSATEATEILLNVKRFASTVAKIAAKV